MRPEEEDQRSWNVWSTQSPLPYDFNVPDDPTKLGAPHAGRHCGKSFSTPAEERKGVFVPKGLRSDWGLEDPGENGPEGPPRGSDIILVGHILGQLEVVRGAGSLLTPTGGQAPLGRIRQAHCPPHLLGSLALLPALKVEWDFQGAWTVRSGSAMGQLGDREQISYLL